MKDKIINWVTVNRKKIAYTVAGLNILSGLSLLSTGQNANGWAQIFLGSIIALDASTMP
jgi:hypothetical protein